MIPLGVEASTATAPAVDAAAPSGFLDGLLAALNDGAAATVVPDQPASVPTTSIPVASPVVAPTATPAMASRQCPCCAVAVSATVSELQSAVAAPEPIADLAVPTEQAADLAVATEQTDDDQPVWSVSAYPGGPQTLHYTAVESFEPPRWAPNTPQHRRSTPPGEGAVVAEIAMASTPSVANVATRSAVMTDGVMATALGANVVTATTSTPRDAAAKNAGLKIVASRNAATERTPVDTARIDVEQPGDVKVDVAQAELPVVPAQNTTTAQPADAPAATASVQHRPNHQPIAPDGSQLLRQSRTPSAAVSLIDAGLRRQPNGPDQRDRGAAHVPAGLSAVRSIVTDRADPAPIVATDTPPVPKVAATTSPFAARASAPASLGMIGVDRVRFAREQAPSRAVQRLAIDLDGAQVALRFDGDRVAVDVLNDPSGNLGNGWARQVERSLDQAARSVNEPQRGGHSADQRGAQPGDSGRRDPSAPDSNDQPHRRSTRAFTLFPEEED